MYSFLIALASLTIFPVRFRTVPPLEEVARSRFWFPLVGLLLGVALEGETALLTRLHSSLLGAFLIVGTWVVLTGALHLDGWCDLCDGLFGGKNPADRLRILRDPHHGTFGMAGGILLLLGKLTALSTLLYREPKEGPYLVAAAVMVSRCFALSMAAGARYPRLQGTGKIIVESTQWLEGFGFPFLAICAILWIAQDNEPWTWAAAFIGGFFVVMVLKGFCKKKLGGITGDCLGAAIESAELTILITWTVVRNG